MFEVLHDNLPEAVKLFRRQYDPATGGYQVPPREAFSGISADIVSTWTNLRPMYDSVEVPVADLLFSLCYNAHAVNILETGTSRGFSTCHLAAAVKENNGKVVTLDLAPAKHLLWQGTDLDEYVIPFFGNSSIASLTKAKDAIGDKQFDVLFLDSLHSYEHLIDEIITFEPLLRVGGLILLHDTLFYDALAFVVDDLEVDSRFQVTTIETHRLHHARTRCPGVTIARKSASGPPVIANHKDKIVGETVILPGSDRTSTSRPLIETLRAARASEVQPAA